MKDFIAYHQETLPALLDSGRAALLAGQKLPPMGLSLSEGDQGFTYRIDPAGVSIEAGTSEATFCVTLAAADWNGLVEDLESVPGILYGGKLVEQTGDMMQFVRWEPALRALYTGRPIFDPLRFELLDDKGQALNPLSAFTPESDAGEMRAFLAAAGYLLVKSVFTPDELDEFRAAASELADQALEGDQLSWWGKQADGATVLCRCLNAGSKAAFSGLYDDPRIARLARLLPEGMLHPQAGETDAVTVIFKNPGVSEGLSDLPWHRDCGMGGHAVMCPNFVFSIYLWDATPEQGCLQFLPGSHRYAYGFADAGEVDIPGAVTVPAQAGDISIHVGDVMHAAPPPSTDAGQFRQSVLLWFHPDFENHRGERHYNDVLLGDEGGQVSHLSSMVNES